jgi:hypothetical protein
MTVTAWPNGLGWDVGDDADDAEVWRRDAGLAVQVLTGDEIKALYIPDPMLDPVEAVRRCRREGSLVVDEPAQG